MRTLLDGSPVPADNSHTAIDPATGMQKNYVVLSAEERAKGFVKPLRNRYVHKVCGIETTMGTSLSETYATNPRFYSGTYCVGCRTHFNLNQFEWSDGEPMDPDLQEAWHAGKSERDAAHLKEVTSRRVSDLKRTLAQLESDAARVKFELAQLEAP